MGYVSYVAYDRHLEVQKRQKTPLGKVLSWLVKRAAGTYIQKSLSFVTQGSWVARYATGITIGLCLGLLLDFSFRFRSLPENLIESFVCLALGAIVGFAAAGPLGSVFGSLWGWLFAGVSGSIAAKMASGPASRISIKIVSWLLTWLVGWWAGLLAQWCFARISRNNKWLWITKRLLITIVFTAIPLFLYRVLSWTIASPKVAALIASPRVRVRIVVCAITLGVAAAVLGANYMRSPSRYGFWFRQTFFLLVALGFGGICIRTHVDFSQVYWRSAPLSRAQLCVGCLAVAILSRFADAGSASAVITKLQAVDPIPGLGDNPSRSRLYVLALYQSLVLTFAAAVLGGHYPLSCIFGLLVVSCAGGMVVLSNQIYYGLCRMPPSFSSIDVFALLRQPLEAHYYPYWGDEQQYEDRLQQYYQSGAHKRHYECLLRAHERDSQIARSIGLLIPAVLGVLFICPGWVTSWAIDSLQLSMEWVVGAVGLWLTYCCLAGLKSVERFPAWLARQVLSVLRSVLRALGY